MYDRKVGVKHTVYCRSFQVSLESNADMPAARLVEATTPFKKFEGTNIPDNLISQLLALIQENMSAFHGRCWGSSSKREELTHPNMVILMHCRANILAAAAAYRLCIEETVRVAYLYELQVARHAQGMGLGSLLLQHVEQAAREADAKGIMLTVHCANKRARSFYHLRSFEASPISPSFCAPPALSHSSKYEVMQKVWDAEATMTLQKRGEAAKEYLWRQAIEDGSLKISLTMRQRKKRASDMNICPSKSQRRISM